MQHGARGESFSLSAGVSESPQYTAPVSVSYGCCNKVPQMERLQQQKCIFSYCWRLEVQGQGGDGAVSPLRHQGRSVPVLSVSFCRSPGWGSVIPNSTWHSPQVHVCVQEHQAYWIRGPPHPLPCDLVLTGYICHGPTQMESPPELTGVRTSTYEFGGRGNIAAPSPPYGILTNEK